MFHSHENGHLINFVFELVHLNRSWSKGFRKIVKIRDFEWWRGEGDALCIRISWFLNAYFLVAFKLNKLKLADLSNFKVRFYVGIHLVQFDRFSTKFEFLSRPLLVSKWAMLKSSVLLFLRQTTAFGAGRCRLRGKVAHSPGLLFVFHLKRL